MMWRRDIDIALRGAERDRRVAVTTSSPTTVTPRYRRRSVGVVHGLGAARRDVHYVPRRHEVAREGVADQRQRLIRSAHRRRHQCAVELRTRRYWGAR